MSIAAKQPMTIEGILSNAIGLYTAVFKKIFPFALILGLLISVPSLYYYLPIDSAQFNLPKTIIFTLTITLALSLVNGCMIFTIGKVVANEDVSFKLALQNGFSKLHIILGSQIIFITFILLLAAFGILISKFSLVFIGIVAFVLLTLMLIIRCYFFLPLIIFDNMGPITAMTQSYHITLGFWWRTLLLTFISSIPHLVFVVLNMPLGLVSKYIVEVMYVIESVVTLPFSLTILYLQYLDLKNRNGITPITSTNL